MMCVTKGPSSHKALKTQVELTKQSLKLVTRACILMHLHHAHRWYMRSAAVGCTLERCCDAYGTSYYLNTWATREVQEGLHHVSIAQQHPFRQQPHMIAAVST